MNLPPLIGSIVSSNRATLHELQSVYGCRDLYDMLEIVSVDAHNARVIRARHESES